MTGITNNDILRSRQLAGRVTRWHTWPMIHKPSNGEHCARMALIYVELFGLPRPEVLYYILTHDHGELLAGDTPYGAKRRVPELADAVNRAESQGRAMLGLLQVQLSDLEKRRVKVCDLLEMWETAWVEMNMGNRYCESAEQSCYHTILGMVCYLPQEDAERIVTWMKEESSVGR